MYDISSLFLRTLRSKASIHILVLDTIALEVLASDVLKILAPSTPFPAWIQAYDTEVI